MTAADARPHHDTPCGVLGAAFDWQVSQQSLTRWADKLGPADAVLLAETVTRYVQVVRNRHDREIAAVMDDAVVAAQERFGHRSRPTAEWSDGTPVMHAFDGNGFCQLHGKHCSMAAEIAADAVCRTCGCTDAASCAGGCTWVADDPGWLCTACAGKVAGP